MKPSRELDALVAKTIFGCSVGQVNSLHANEPVVALKAVGVDV